MSTEVVVAPDKFAGTLTAAEAASCIADGWRSHRPEDTVVLRPVADGGEGTIDALEWNRADGEVRTLAVADPLGREVDARWLLTSDGDAIIEVAEACGLKHLTGDERRPLETTTAAVGTLLTEARRAGARRIVVGLGGSATVDGGVGMAQALGARFLDTAGRAVGDDWRTRTLDRLEWSPRPMPPIVVASDVRNPLLGPRGAARVFGPQKGASPDDIVVLEDALARLADVVERTTGTATREVPGAGAAGGLGFMLLSLFPATLAAGARVVAEMIGLPEAVAGADVVVTGEGKLDTQTAEGKAPAHVAQLGRTAGAWVGAVVGSCEPGADADFDAVAQTGAAGLRAPRDEVTRAAARLAAMSPL